MLGLAVGRMGASSGCCHGRPVPGSETGTLLSMPGGSIVFVDGAPVIAFNFVSGVGVGSIHGEAIYPTQMFESLGALSIFISELDVDQHGGTTLRRPRNSRPLRVDPHRPSVGWYHGALTVEEGERDECIRTAGRVEHHRDLRG